MNLAPEPFKDYHHHMMYNREEENLSALEIYEQFRDQLPLIVVVTIGDYSDKHQETFGSDQIFRIECMSYQKRAIARDKDGRYLTIPLAIPVQFRVVKGYKKVGDPQTIEDIIDSNDLPVQVQFIPEEVGRESVRVGASVTSLKQFGNVVITEVYEEKYFVANGLNSGMLYHKCLLIPVELREVCFARVTSIKGGDEQDWTNFNIGLQKAADSYTYDVSSEYREVDILPEDSGLVTSDNIYDYIDPSVFGQLRRNKKEKTPEGNVYVQLFDKDEKKPPKPAGKTIKAPKLPFRNILAKIPTGKFHSKTPASPPNQESNQLSKSQPKSPISPPNHDTTLQWKLERNESINASGGSVSSLGSDSGDYAIDLTISDIEEVLKKLNLRGYVTALREAQVDGACLLQLGVETLKEDFNMKGFEAKKLMLFARTGHLPC